MQLDHLLRNVLPVILLIAFGFWQIGRASCRERV